MLYIVVFCPICKCVLMLLSWAGLTSKWGWTEVESFLVLGANLFKHLTISENKMCSQGKVEPSGDFQYLCQKYSLVIKTRALLEKGKFFSFLILFHFFSGVESFFCYCDSKFRQITVILAFIKSQMCYTHLWYDGFDAIPPIIELMGKMLNFVVKGIKLI